MARRMSSITIRNLDPETVRNAKIRAKARGRSMEHELRDLISRTYSSSGAVWDRVSAVRDELKRDLLHKGERLPSLAEICRDDHDD